MQAMPTTPKERIRAEQNKVKRAAVEYAIKKAGGDLTAAAKVYGCSRQGMTALVARFDLEAYVDRVRASVGRAGLSRRAVTT